MNPLGTFDASKPLEVQYNKSPVLDPVPNSCPEGFRYRKPYYVPGSCIRNTSDNIGNMKVDDRCPQGMFWRNTFEVKAGCVRLRTQARLKKNMKDIKPTLPTCSSDVVRPIFTDHLKIILSSLEEYFTVPISREDLVTRAEVFAKMKRRFYKSIQKRLSSNACEYRPTPTEFVQVENVINSMVTVFNSKFLTPEKWQVVARAAELDLLLLISREMVKNEPALHAFTLNYMDQLHELRRLLQYMDEEKLLPRQNMAVALAYYNYLNKFRIVPNMHGVLGVDPPTPPKERVQNYDLARNKVIVDGFVRRLHMTPDTVATLPTNLRTLTPVTLPETELLQAAPLVESSLIPILNEMGEAEHVVPNVTLQVQPYVYVPPGDTTPAEPFTEELMNELYDMFVLFRDYNKKLNAELTVRGAQLAERYQYLFTELARYQNFKLSDEDLYRYIQNYGQSQLDPVQKVTISALNAKYNGPFWAEQTVTVHCPYCNQLLEIRHYVPQMIVKCPSCHHNIKLT